MQTGVCQAFRTLFRGWKPQGVGTMTTEISTELEAPAPIGRINPALARSRPPHAPAQVAQVIRLAHWLEPLDRGLIQSVYRDGISIESAAAVLGMTPASTRRRVHRLWLRLTDPEFAWVVERIHGWEPTRRAVALACLVHGLSLRHTAARLGLTMHIVRSHVAAAHAAFEVESPRMHSRALVIRHVV